MQSFICYDVHLAPEKAFQIGLELNLIENRGTSSRCNEKIDVARDSRLVSPDRAKEANVFEAPPSRQLKDCRALSFQSLSSGRAPAYVKRSDDRGVPVP